MKQRVADAVRDLLTYENRPLDEGPMDRELEALLAKIK